MSRFVSCLAQISVRSDGVIAAVEVSNMPKTLTAGENFPALSLNFRDALGNTLDYAGSVQVEITKQDGAKIRLRLETAAAQAGILNASPFQATTAGTYRLLLDSAASAARLGNDQTLVSPAAASAAEFIGVPDSVTAGAPLPALSLRLRDAYGNLTDFETGITYANADNSSAGTITLARTALGASTATQTLFTTAGNYTLWAQGFVETTAPLAVRPAQAMQAVFEGVTATIPVGSEQTQFTVSYYDEFGNRAKPRFHYVLYTGARDGVTVAQGSIQTEPIGFGTERSLVETPPATFAETGVYRLFGAGGVGTNLGATTFEVIVPPAVGVEFANVRSGLLFDEPQAAFLVRFHDAAGNLTDNIGETPLVVTITLPNNGGTVTWNLERLQTGEYRVVAPTAFTQAGLYALNVGALAVLDQGFFSVAAPGFFNSTAFVNAASRRQGLFIVDLETTGLNFDTVRVGTVSPPLVWSVISSAANRVRLTALPAGFEVSANNGATWLRFNGGAFQTSQDNGATWTNTTAPIFTLPSTVGTLSVTGPNPGTAQAPLRIHPPNLDPQVNDPGNPQHIPEGSSFTDMLVRFRPTAAGEVTGNFSLQIGNSPTVIPARPALSFTQVNPVANPLSVLLRGAGSQEQLLARRGQTQFPHLHLQFADLVPSGTNTQTFALDYANTQTITLTAPNGFRLSTEQDPTPSQTKTVAGGASGTINVTVHITVPTGGGGVYAGAVNIASGTGLSRITVPVTCYAFECAAQEPRTLVNMPKIKILTIYTRAAQNRIAGNTAPPCDGAIYGTGRDIYDYVEKNIYVTNRVNYNSGVQFRMTNDPVIIPADAANFRLSNPLVIPADSAVTITRMDGTTFQSALMPGLDDNNGIRQLDFFGDDGNDGIAPADNWHDRLATIDFLGDPNTPLRLYQRQVGADMIAVIANVLRDGGVGGIAGRINDETRNATLQYSYFLVDALDIDSFNWTHEMGHVVGLRHKAHFGSFPLDLRDRAVQDRYLCDNRIDRGNPQGRMWTATSVMNYGGPRAPYWSHADAYYGVPGTNVVYPTITGAAERNRDGTEGIGSGPFDEVRQTLNQANASLRFPALYPNDDFTRATDDIDAWITGPSELNGNASATYRLNVCGGAGVPATWQAQWYSTPLQEFRAPAQVGPTTPTFDFTMPAGRRYTLLKVVALDGARRKISAEKVVSCGDCALTVPPLSALAQTSPAGGVQSVAADYVPELPSGIESELGCALPHETQQSPGLRAFDAGAEGASSARTAESLPAVTELRSSAPNPASAETRVGFGLAETGRVKLALYDAFGREVLTVCDEFSRAGERSFSVGVRELPAGVYSWRLSAAGRTQTQRLVIAR